MPSKALRRLHRATAIAAIAFAVGGFIAQLASLLGGEFPLIAILWCAVFYFLAAASFVVWLIAHVKLERSAHVEALKP